MRDDNRPDDAIKEREAIVRDARQILPPGDLRYTRFQLDLAELLVGTKLFERAEPLLLDALGAADKQNDAALAHRAATLLQSLFQAWEKPQKAAVYTARLSATMPTTAASRPLIIGPITAAQLDDMNRQA